MWTKGRTGGVPCTGWTLLGFIAWHWNGMKAAFKMLGRDMGDPRPPRLPLRPELARELRRVMTGMGLFDQVLPVVDKAA